MAAPKGNQFWKARAKHGRDKIFATAQELWEAAVEYFEWVEANPLKKAIVHQGAVTGQESLMRAMTIDALCFYLQVNKQYLTEFESNLDMGTQEGKDFSVVIRDIYSIIRSQKFEGASAGLLNPNIIARDLGLVDKQSSELTGKDGGAIQTKTLVVKGV
jgi:hypothetical protein